MTIAKKKLKYVHQKKKEKRNIKFQKHKKKFTKKISRKSKVVGSCSLQFFFLSVFLLSFDLGQRILVCIRLVAGRFLLPHSPSTFRRIVACETTFPALTRKINKNCVSVLKKRGKEGGRNFF